MKELGNYILIEKKFGYTIYDEPEPLLDITLWKCFKDYKFVTKELLKGYTVIKKVKRKKATIVVAKMKNCLYYEVIPRRC